MTRESLTTTAGILLLSAAVLSAAPVHAASHQWRFNEVFSTADGTIQFIEMKECCGFTSENALNGKWILAVDADLQYNFPANIAGNTANRHLLLATQAFADLPGVPVPDFIIPEGFLPLGGETLEYWMYVDATWTYGAMPTDGVNSIHADGSTGVNSPTNFAGESVTVSVPVTPVTWGMIKSGNPGPALP